jgi:ribosomal protein S18 acetylase RimI-like enzyme
VSAISNAASTAAQWELETYRTFCSPAEETACKVAKVLFVACVGSRQNLVGFAAFQAILATGECGLENMAVAEESRRSGIGRRLLSSGLLWCRGWRAAAPWDSGQDENVWLEVRPSNRAAVHLYLKAGFIEAGRRSGYYSHPIEDALLMRRNTYLLA